jgi:hypothetical protein
MQVRRCSLLLGEALQALRRQDLEQKPLELIRRVLLMSKQLVVTEREHGVSRLTRDDSPCGAGSGADRHPWGRVVATVPEARLPFDADDELRVYDAGRED